MGQLDVHATVTGIGADEVYRRIAAFGDYARLCDAVREVEVIDSGPGRMTSRWEVNFHRGILRWTEQAEFRPDEGVIDFADIDGDIDEFRGQWRIAGQGDTAGVVFSVQFDIGIPTLEHILDPIAAEAIQENVSSILRGLLGAAVTIRPAAGSPASRCLSTEPHLD